MFGKTEELIEIQKGQWVRPQDVQRIEVQKRKVLVHVAIGEPIEALPAARESAEAKAKSIANKVNAGLRAANRSDDDQRPWERPYPIGRFDSDPVQFQVRAGPWGSGVLSDEQ